MRARKTALRVDIGGAMSFTTHRPATLRRRGIYFLVVAFIGSTEPEHHNTTTQFWFGGVLIVVGMAAFFLYGWMARRGI
jgi:hypothetical protein